MLSSSPVERARELLCGLSAKQPCVYFLRQESGMLYIGATTDLLQRMEAHVRGNACKTTTHDPPIALLGIEILPNVPAARSREAQLKRWSRAKKEALIRGDIPSLKRLSRSRLAR